MYRSPDGRQVTLIAGWAARYWLAETSSIRSAADSSILFLDGDWT